ncbi:MAG TPA: hypothetical protein VJP81_00940 [Candidatus Dormibacteraeota bacterium]|nr:hypothetical protein [Candidatus Dormibacteraeota bacterium]
MNRLICALPAAALTALTLSPAAVTASPSPSPSLDQVLVGPPSGYQELTTSQLHGQFDAHGWATTVATGSDATETEKTLMRDGFVDGFGKTWAQAGAGHALIEAVMAFNGGQGARKALTALEASDKADVSYKHADTASGIDPYYGAHLEDTATRTYGDLFVFAKGNDVFFVILASQNDDVLQLATNQVKAQFDAAPSSTIPTSQWPENISPAGAFPVVGLGAIAGIVILVAVVVGVVAVRRRGTAMPAMAGAGIGGGPGAIQLSQDGNYWWDGQTWRDASREVPSTAQRSSDGALWWDGRAWRPVPAQPEQPPVT